MIALVTQKREEIAGHCRRLNVRKLEIFGSAATGAFDPEKSDLDFLVEFGEDDKLDLADRYFDLAESLEELFGREVDLIRNRPFKNPYFRASVEAEKELVYAP
jgi:predicted nucleotidyltransferase